MIKLPIKPVHNEAYNCFDDSIAVVAACFDKEYELMFLESWGFSFIPSNLGQDYLLSDRINTDVGDKNRLLGKYHGININMENNLCSSTLFNIKKEIELNRPLLLDIDGYSCHWDLSYEKVHTEHSCLITGINDENSEIYCTDAFYNKEHVCLPIEKFNEGFVGYSKFVINNDKNINYDCKNILMSSISRLKNSSGTKNSFDEIRLFANQIIEPSYIKNDKEKCGDRLSEIFMKLWLIRVGRSQYSIMLKYLANKYNVDELFELADYMFKIASQWYTINSMFAKAYQISDPDKILYRIYDKLIAIADQEEILHEKLLEICM